MVGMVTAIIFIIFKKYKAGKVMLISTCVVFYFLSIEPVAFLLARSLEEKVSINNTELETNNAVVIVILAGGVSKRGGNRSEHELSGTGWKRLLHGIKMFRQFKGSIPILYSGGSGDPFDSVPVEAQLAKNFAVSIGIPLEMIWLESTSRNTYESGVEIKRFLDDKYQEVVRHKIILVTSASHMLRAIKVMNKAGLNTIPSPSDFTAGSLKLDPLSFLPSSSHFSSSTFSIHEWIGIGGYWLMGRV